MTIDIDKLEALARAATPGPWDTDEGGEVHSGGRTIYAKPGLDGKDQKDADMQYGAAADPQTTLALISRLREAEQRDAALAYVSRVKDAWKRYEDAEWCSDEEESAEAELHTAMDTLPEDSLARRDLMKQAEVLEAEAEYLGIHDEAYLVCRARELRRQAQEGDEL